MIQCLIQTSITKIGIGGTCAAFGVAGLAGGFILYPIIVKTIELAKKLFQYIKQCWQEQNFTQDVKSMFCNQCLVVDKKQENGSFFKGEKVTTVTKETVFIPKKEIQTKIHSEIKFEPPKSPTQPRLIGDSPPPSYDNAEEFHENKK